MTDPEKFVYEDVAIATYLLVNPIMVVGPSFLVPLCVVEMCVTSTKWVSGFDALQLIDVGAAGVCQVSLT